MAIFKTPILLLIFNRPEVTKKIFQEIQKLKPKYLFLSSDGPRKNIKNEKEKIEQTRKIILNNINWDCDLKTLVRKDNLGCKIAVSSAIDWFFKYVEQGIILEDDCLPNQSFFYFCENLLNKYKHDGRIMHISGNNFFNNEQIKKNSYYFSRIPHIWGWATWKRAWKKYDVNIKNFPNFKKNNLIKNIFNKNLVQSEWNKVFQKVYKNKIDTWDYQWTYTVFTNNGLCINPNLNLISNVGFTKESTHTKNENIFSNLPIYKLNKIVHPKFIIPNIKKDNFILKQNFGFSWIKKIKYKINLCLKKY